MTRCESWTERKDVYSCYFFVRMVWISSRLISSISLICSRLIPLEWRRVIIFRRSYRYHILCVSPPKNLQVCKSNNNCLIEQVVAFLFAECQCPSFPPPHIVRKTSLSTDKLQFLHSLSVFGSFLRTKSSAHQALPANSN